MTATDELRKLLDERGVGWTYDHGTVEFAINDYWCYAWEYSDNKMCISISCLTPAQAIAVTLGRGTCKMEQMSECQFDDIACSECGVALWAFSMDKAGEGVIATPNYCPNCGAKVVEE